MKTEKNYIPKAQREVWAWKESISEDVKHLPTDQALRKILETARGAAQQLGFATQEPVDTAALAETPPDYGPKTASQPRRKEREN